MSEVEQRSEVERLRARLEVVEASESYWRGIVERLRVLLSQVPDARPEAAAAFRDREALERIADPDLAPNSDPMAWASRMHETAREALSSETPEAKGAEKR